MLLAILHASGKIDKAKVGFIVDSVPFDQMQRLALACCSCAPFLVAVFVGPEPGLSFMLCVEEAFAKKRKEELDEATSHEDLANEVRDRLQRPAWHSTQLAPFLRSPMAICFTQAVEANLPLLIEAANRAGECAGTAAHLERCIARTQVLATRACANLGCLSMPLKADSNGKSKLCSACMTVRYCSTACQKADWKGHKIACRALKERRM